jgi:polyphosphate glucokinase
MPMSIATPQPQQADEQPLAPPEAAPPAPFTLAVDVGGTNVKAAVLDAQGRLAAAQLRAPTPKRATPEAVLAIIAGLAAHLPPFHRISVGFPGVVKGGTTLSAPNLGNRHWAGYKLAEALEQRFGAPARILNDAAVQGLGVVEGPGLECVLTLGTGVGCAVFRNRRLLLHIELGQHRGRKRRTYDQYIGNAVLLKKGERRWNKRVRKTIDMVTSLTNCDVLYIGGGNARKVAPDVPAHVKIVSNTAGVTGGIRLWEPGIDELFAEPPQLCEEVLPAPTHAARST